MSRKNVSWIISILMSLTPLVVPASAQHFQQVKGTLVGVSAGRNEVFGFDVDANVYRYHASTESFAKIAGASLYDIAVGGGTLSQLDDVWGIKGDSTVYRFNYTTKVFDQIPGASLFQITVGVGNQDSCHPYEVWGVDSVASIYRYDYCASEFLQVAGLLTQVVTGGGDVWGINSAQQVFHFDFGTQSFGQVPGSLTQIAVGVNDVWGIIDSSNAIFRYDARTDNFNFVVAGAAQVAAGGDGVWAISVDDGINRFDSSPEIFVEVTGSLRNISVGSGAGVWGINSSNQVFTFVRP